MAHLRFALILCLTLALDGCAIPSSLNPFQSADAPSMAIPAPRTSSLAWARNDGQLISGSADLKARAGTDIAECRATAPPVRTDAGIAGEMCMNGRGYHVREVP